MVGIFGYVLFGVAMALLKYGADSLATPRQIFRDRLVRLRFIVWLIGMVTNTIYVAVITIALGFGKASVISAFNGVGLAVLAVLSHFFLKEPIGRFEIGGLTFIIFGTGTLGLMGGTEVEIYQYSISAFILMNLILFSILLLSTLFTFLRKYAGAAIIFSITAGSLGGISLLYQKIFMTHQIESAGLWKLLQDPYFLIFLIVSNGSFVVLQVAYQFGKAVTIVPIFSSTFIVMPVIGAIWVFSEAFLPWQGVGIVLILVGIVFLTGLSGSEKEVI